MRKKRNLGNHFQEANLPGNELNSSFIFQVLNTKLPVSFPASSVFSPSVSQPQSAPVALVFP